MHRYPGIWLVIILIFQGLSACSQDDPRLAAIDKEVKLIEANKVNLAQAEIELKAYSLEGGIARIYRNQLGNIRLIEVEQYGEVAMWKESIYFKDGQLIYIYSQDHTFNASQDITEDMAKQNATEAFDPDKTVVSRNWYYFNEALLIHWIDNDRNPVDPKSEEFIMAETDYREYVDQLLMDVTQ